MLSRRHGASDFCCNLYGQRKSEEGKKGVKKRFSHSDDESEEEKAEEEEENQENEQRAEDEEANKAEENENGIPDKSEDEAPQPSESEEKDESEEHSEEATTKKKHGSRLSNGKKNQQGEPETRKRLSLQNPVHQINLNRSDHQQNERRLMMTLIQVQMHPLRGGSMKNLQGLLSLFKVWIKIEARFGHYPLFLSSTKMSA